MESGPFQDASTIMEGCVSTYYIQTFIYVQTCHIHHTNTSCKGYTLHVHMYCKCSHHSFHLIRIYHAVVKKHAETGIPKDEAKVRAKWACKLAKDLLDRTDVWQLTNRKGQTWIYIGGLEIKIVQ